MEFNRSHASRLVVLLVYFLLLGFILWNYHPGYIILPVLVVSSIVWFAFEYSRGVKRKALNAAFEIGLFLMVFDFAVQNIGALYNLWQVSRTAFHVIYVPIEVMALTLIGGTAWALAQPKKFNSVNSALDILLFSVFGMVGESLLIKNNVMFYSGGWTPVHAFLGYFVTWSILHYLRYRVVPIVWK